MNNFPFGINGKLIILGVPILKHITVYVFLHAVVLSHCKYLYILKENPRKDWTVSNWAFSLLLLLHCFTSTVNI